MSDQSCLSKSSNDQTFKPPNSDLQPSRLALNEKRLTCSTQTLFTMSNNWWPSSPSSHGGSPEQGRSHNPACETCQGTGKFLTRIDYWEERPCDFVVGHCTIDGHTAGCQQRFIESGRTQRFCPCGFCLGSGIRRYLTSRVEQRSCSCLGFY